MVFYDDTHELTLHIQFTCIKCNNENGNIRKKNGLYNQSLKQQLIKTLVPYISKEGMTVLKKVSQDLTGQHKK